LLKFGAEIDHMTADKSSSSNGQRSRLQREVTILLKFRVDFDHVTCDVPQIFKIKGSKVKVTA